MIMKRIFFLLVFALISVAGFSQDNFEGITGLKYLSSDTTQTNTILILNGDTVKFNTATLADKQILQRILTGGKHIWTNQTVAFPEGLVYGGEVTRIDSLTFDVRSATYYISQNFYQTVRDTVTLGDPDPTNPRIDIIAVNTSGQVEVIAGTPNVNPQKPSVNPLTQVELTQILVSAGSVVPEIITENSYAYWGVSVNNGASRLIKSQDFVSYYGLTDGVIISRDAGTANLRFKADTTLLATLTALKDTAQVLRGLIPVITPDTLFTTVPISDESTALTTGTGKRTFRMPVGCTLTKVRASVITAPTGANLIFDINENGASVLSTKLSIDAGEKTSVTAASQAVISDSSIADDAEMTIDIDQIGSTIAGAGAKITIYYLKN